MEGLGLGLRPWPGLKLGPRPGAAVGLGVAEEQQTTGQGWLEHRSKVGMTGPGAELVRPVVTEEARGYMSQRWAAEPPPRTQVPAPIPTLQTHGRHAPSSREGGVPGTPVVTGDCRSWVVPKLWLDLLGRGGLSSEGLQEPGQGGLGVPERWTGMAEKRQGARSQR